jgi:hypothetical protein
MNKAQERLILTMYTLLEQVNSAGLSLSYRDGFLRFKDDDLQNWVVLDWDGIDDDEWPT